MAARNPISNIIIGEIITALGAMATGNDYNYTQDSNNVFDWLDRQLDIDNEVTSIDVRDERSSQERETESNVYINIIEVHITILRPGDGARAILRKTKQDVLKAMFEDFMSDTTQRINDIDYTGDEPEIEREKKLIGAADMIFNIEYPTTRGQI